MSFTHLFIQFILFCCIFNNCYSQSPTSVDVLSAPSSPVAVALDSSGNFYVSVEQYYVTTGPIAILRYPNERTLTSSSTYDLTFTQWGNLSTNTFLFPDSIILDQYDTLWVTDSVNNIICYWRNAKDKTAVSGIDAGQADGYFGGTGTSAHKFNGNIGINFDLWGNLWVADRLNYRVVMWPGVQEKVLFGEPITGGATFCLSVNPTTVSNCLSSTGTTPASGNQPIYVWLDAFGNAYVSLALGTTTPGSVVYYSALTLLASAFTGRGATPDSTVYLDNCAATGYPNPDCLPFGITFTDSRNPYLVVSDTSNSQLVFFSYPVSPLNNETPPTAAFKFNGGSYTFEPISSVYSAASNTLWVTDTAGARTLAFRNFFPSTFHW